MPRVHLFEFEDQPWFPALIRDAGTAYLGTAERLAGHPRLLAPKVAETLRRSGERQILDLCSGGAGPIPAVLDAMAEEGLEARATLTDLYPNHSALGAIAAQHAKIDFRRESLDATKVPPELPGLRTLFNSLHHFRPEAAREILATAAASRRPIAAFEILARHPLPMLTVLLSPIAVLLLVPFLRPFRPAWLVFTYLLPIIPLFVLWDGLVSCLRIYSVSELETLVAGLETDRYHFEVGRIRLGESPAFATYVTGLPS